MESKNKKRSCLPIFCLFESTLDYFVHNSFLLDNGLNEFHLCPAAIETVPFPMNLVINISPEIVRQEPYM